MLSGTVKWALWAAMAVTLAAADLAPRDTGPAGHRPHYRVGQPYRIDGVWYYPKEDWSYDRTGIASWYGQPFHGRRTADGEIFNLHALTAAHRTLPMPVVVRVTNLDNGRSLKLRVNDRGPFVADDRIIDVSKRAARLLGFERAGLATVRVQIDVKDSLRIAGAAGRGTLFGYHVDWPAIVWPNVSLAAIGLTTPALIALASALAGVLGFWLLVLDDGRRRPAPALNQRPVMPEPSPRRPEP